MSFVVAIDGPAGAGKGTVTKRSKWKIRLSEHWYRSYVSLCYS